MENQGSDRSPQAHEIICQFLNGLEPEDASYLAVVSVFHRIFAVHILHCPVCNRNYGDLLELFKPPCRCAGKTEVTGNAPCLLYRDIEHLSGRVMELVCAKALAYMALYRSQEDDVIAQGNTVRRTVPRPTCLLGQVVNQSELSELLFQKELFKHFAAHFEHCLVCQLAFGSAPANHKVAGASTALIC